MFSLHSGNSVDVDFCISSAYAGFSLLGGWRESPPPAKSLLIPPTPYLEKFPPPNFNSLPTKSKFLLPPLNKNFQVITQ